MTDDDSVIDYTVIMFEKTATTNLMNTGLYAEKVRLRDECEKFKRAYIDEREKFASYRRTHPEKEKATVTAPREYHITKGIDGQPVLTVGDDAITIANGRADIEALFAACILALRVTR